MKRRTFLGTAIATVSSAVLIHYVLRNASEMAPTNAKTASKQFKVNKTEQEWRKVLTSEQFRVLRQQGTELAGSSPLDKKYDKGTYSCAGCDLPLFKSETKFDSGTGWPSFYAPIQNAIATEIDKSLLMTRVEVHCQRCGGHLGHVFEDGPKPTGKRYCMNGVALKFTPG